MIPNGTKVRIANVHKDTSLDHVAGFEGEVVHSYLYPPQRTPGQLQVRHYLVLVLGLDYDLTAAELELVQHDRA